MILELLTYILKVDLLFAVMYLAYRLLLQRTVFHNWNRFYLLVAPLLAISLPFISVQSATSPIYVIELPEIYSTAGAATIETSSISIWSMILLVWISGAFISLFTMVRNVRKSYNALKRDQVGAFTFFRKVHIDHRITGSTRAKIAAHEQVHADQLHTLDLLWYELLRVVFWFDPLFLLARRSLKVLHEYIADHQANRMTEDYAETLVANAFGLSVLPLANEFKSNNIKNRISMITKKKSTGQRIALLGSILLVAVASVSIGWTAVVVPDHMGKEEVYDKVEKMPQFPGCDASKVKAEEMKKCSMDLLIQFMGATVKYPKKSQKENAEGTVMVKFVVMSDGSIKKAEVVKGVTEELDAEALRVISTMPNWVPGEQKGEKVNVSIVLPISFKLS